MTERSPKIDIRPDHWEIVQSILKKHVPQHEVWAFGSRVKWTAKAYSDLDLAVITDKPLSLDVSASLSDDFSESDLPYKVDVVDWATTSESFRKIIERDRVVVQKRGRSWVMRSKPFRELFSIPLRNGLTKPKAVRGAGTKMVNMGELFANPRLINVDMDRVPMNEAESKSSMLEPDDLLFARQSLVLSGAGKCSIFVCDGEEVCFESHVIRCRLKKDLADPHFYFYFFGSAAGRRLIETIVEQGAGASGIRGSDLAELSVPWVDPSVQRCIAQVLRHLDDKIDINRRINQTLEAMAQAVFKSWFVDFEPVKAKIAAKAEGHDPLRAAMTTISGKPDAELDTLPPDQFVRLAATAALFPDEMEDSELGEMPKGWTIQSMAQLTTKIGSGSTPRGGKEVYLDEGIALIRSQNIYDSLFVWEGLARITDEAAAQLKGVTVQDNDVLLNITGASILRTCVVLPDVLPARVNQHVAIIRAKAGVPARFLHQHLLLPETKNHLLGLNAGGSREAVTKAHIESLKLLVPSADLLAAFEVAVTPMFVQVESCARQMRALAALRDTLLPIFLSGELQVHQTEAEVAA